MAYFICSWAAVWCQFEQFEQVFTPARLRPVRTLLLFSSMASCLAFPRCSPSRCCWGWECLSLWPLSTLSQPHPHILKSINRLHCHIGGVLPWWTPTSPLTYPLTLRRRREMDSFFSTVNQSVPRTSMFWMKSTGSNGCSGGENAEEGDFMSLGLRGGRLELRSKLILLSWNGLVDSLYYHHPAQVHIFSFVSLSSSRVIRW